MAWPRLYFLPSRQEFCEAPPGQVALTMTDEAVILKCAYLGPNQIDDESRNAALQALRQSPPEAVLRLIPSPDGPPFRAAIPFVLEGSTYVERVADVRDSRAQVRAHDQVGIQYGAQYLGKLTALQTDYERGRPGFLVTGSPNAAEFWRVKRLEVDGIGRCVVTMLPTRPSFGIVTPKLQSVPQPLQGVLLQHFDELQRAMGSGSPFGVIDRAYNLTEGILEFCLRAVERDPESTLDKKLRAARAILDMKPADQRFPLDHLGYHLAQKIRFLHKYLHVDQSVGKGKEIKPELGLSVAVDVGELMVGVGLGSYQ